MCVRVDGLHLSDVAELAHVEARNVQTFLCDCLDPLDEASGDLLRGAIRGDLIGPVDSENGYTLIEVREKHLPDPEDAVVRQRASEFLMMQTEQRLRSELVNWSTPFSTGHWRD